MTTRASAVAELGKIKIFAGSSDFEDKVNLDFEAGVSLEASAAAGLEDRVPLIVADL